MPAAKLAAFQGVIVTVRWVTTLCGMAAAKGVMAAAKETASLNVMALEK